MLKDLAQVTVDTLFKDANAVEGKLTLTVGRVGVYVKKQEIRTECRVSTPRLTAAVKGSFLEMENSPDLGVLVLTALGDIGVINEFNIERQIGESVSPQRERAILRDRLMLWRKELGRRGMDGDFGGRFMRRFGDGAGPGGAPRPGGLDDMQGMRTPLRAPIGGLVQGAFGGSRLPALMGPGGGLYRFTGANGTNMAARSGLPPFSGSRFCAEVDRLAVMDEMEYDRLARYLRRDGTIPPAIIDYVQFRIAHNSHPRRMRWLNALIDSSPHGRSLRDAIANPP
ncbi:MAG: hypothetical protein RDV41_13065, partial [Planctomycetota bacterium]|nr:hypothetical protein [Planctomycetota bacterium]